MDEQDILKSIAENLSERKSTAALNNYEVLCNNIKYVNELLLWGVNYLKELQYRIDECLQNDELVTTDYKNDTKSDFYFRTIIPRIILNDISVIEKFVSYTKSDDRDGITVETVGVLKKNFCDYNNLVTSTRQFIDSLCSDAYQLTILDPKETNFHVLTSLNSFNKYATKSIRQALFNSDIQNALAEFGNLSYNERVRGNTSAITKCGKRTFGEKVDYLFDNLGLTNEVDFKEEIKNLFSFSSEFTHIGYVSTFFTSSNDSEVVFADDISPYLPSTENFSELKYQILETAINFYAKIYLPSIAEALKKSLEEAVFKTIEDSLNQVCLQLKNNLATRYNTYYFFIKQGLIDTDEIIDLKCMCGTVNHWKAPHDLTEIYCKKCGSKFNLLEIEGNSGYVITSNGPVKVIGSSVPDFDDLSMDEKLELLKQCDEITHN